MLEIYDNQKKHEHLLLNFLFFSPQFDLNRTCVMNFFVVVCVVFFTSFVTNKSRETCFKYETNERKCISSLCNLKFNWSSVENVSTSCEIFSFSFITRKNPDQLLFEVFVRRGDDDNVFKITKMYTLNWLSLLIATVSLYMPTCETVNEVRKVFETFKWNLSKSDLNLNYIRRTLISLVMEHDRRGREFYILHFWAWKLYTFQSQFRKKNYSQQSEIELNEW